MTEKLSPVHVTRVIPASREEVFRAFTDPEAIPLWLGGQSEGDTTRVVELDLREGGRYAFQGTMKGKTWEIHGMYREVAIPESSCTRGSIPRRAGQRRARASSRLSF